MSEETKAETKKEETRADKTVEVPKKFEKIVKEIAAMSVLDLSELVKVFEDKFGVSAAAPLAVAAAAPAVAEEAAEEKSSFTIVITDAGAKKIAVIKAVRAVTELGLKDAKDLVDKLPGTVRENVPKEEAEKIKQQLEEAGAKVELK